MRDPRELRAWLRVYSFRVWGLREFGDFGLRAYGAYRISKASSLGGGSVGGLAFEVQSYGFWAGGSGRCKLVWADRG